MFRRWSRNPGPSPDPRGRQAPEPGRPSSPGAELGGDGWKPGHMAYGTPTPPPWIIPPGDAVPGSQFLPPPGLASSPSRSEMETRRPLPAVPAIAAGELSSRRRMAPMGWGSAPCHGPYRGFGPSSHRPATVDERDQISLPVDGRRRTAVQRRASVGRRRCVHVEAPFYPHCPPRRSCRATERWR